MLSKNKIRFILSLQKKKVRDELTLFIIEGDKLVREFLHAGLPVKSLFAESEFIKRLPANQIKTIPEVVEVSFDDLKRISTLKTPHSAIAVVNMPDSGKN